MLSHIERSKDRLLTLATGSPAARTQIVAAVVAYWADMPGVAVNILDKLLNYTILTPAAAVAWALGPPSLGTGASLAAAWRYELVAGTVAKVAARVRQIVAARCQPGLPLDQVEMLEDTLARERAAMRELFKAIEDAVVGVAEGANDGLLEAAGRGEVNDEDAGLIKAWGGRWARVFRRKALVEEAAVADVAVAMRVSYLEAEAEAEAEQKAKAKAREDEQARVKAEVQQASAMATTAEQAGGAVDAEMMDQGYEGVE